MSIATLTSKGQTTIPKDIRQFLKIKAGDRLEFIVKQDGEAVLKPALTQVQELKGMLAVFAKNKTISIEEMNQAIRKKSGRNV